MAGPLPRRPRLRRGLDPQSWSRVACWWSADRWVAHAELVYRRHYLSTRAQLVERTGGGISLRAVLAVAAAHAAVADHRTGRCSRPVVGASTGLHGLTAATGYGERTIQRARTWLLLVGLATEVAPGRHRTYLERMDSWRRGDRARGWASDWALHPSSTHPVDNLSTVTAGQNPYGTPPRRGNSCYPTSRSRVVSTGEQTEDRRAPRATTPKRRAKTRTTPDPKGLLLAHRWRTHPERPAWALRGTPESWGALLALPARHGWTARDLVALVDDHATAGGRVLHNPRRPVGYLSWLLSRVDLDDRPCALDDARHAQEVAAATRRKAEQAAASRQLAAERQVALAALGGPGHRAARAAAATVARRSRGGAE